MVESTYQMVLSTIKTNTHNVGKRIIAHEGFE